MRRTTTTAVLGGALALALAGSGSAEAQQFTIPNDVSTSSTDPWSNQAASYVGPGASGDYRGVSLDGGYDAFDAWGFQIFGSGLSLSRRTEAFQSMNLYRFFDTFTNTTGNQLSATVTFRGNLGSDGYGTTVLSNAHLNVTEDQNGYDPTLALVHGNNSFAQNNMVAGFTGYDDYTVNTTLNLAPGESQSLLFFAFLARDLGRGTSWGYTGPLMTSDRNLALTRGQELVANPYLTGLSDSEIARIQNFDAAQSSVTPEPVSMALLGTGLAGLGALRRRRRKGDEISA